MTPEVRALCDQAVLCWLATVDAKGRPNVSPKETFAATETGLVIAHIASPRSAKNIAVNPAVCVAVVDIFEQRGYQLRGQAEVHEANSERFLEHLPVLRAIAPEPYPIKAIIEVAVDSTQQIIAPSSWLFPGEDAATRRAETLSAYGVTDVT